MKFKGRVLPAVLAGNQGLGLYLFPPIISPSREVGLDCNREMAPCLKKIGEKIATG